MLRHQQCDNLASQTMTLSSPHSQTTNLMHGTHEHHNLFLGVPHQQKWSGDPAQLLSDNSLWIFLSCLRSSLAGRIYLEVELSEHEFHRLHQQPPEKHTCHHKTRQFLFALQLKASTQTLSKAHQRKCITQHTHDQILLNVTHQIYPPLGSTLTHAQQNAESWAAACAMELFPFLHLKETGIMAGIVLTSLTTWTQT